MVLIVFPVKEVAPPKSLFMSASVGVAGEVTAVEAKPDNTIP